jgi:beta-1,4-N-acetylglucosaminyltransferase
MIFLTVGSQAPFDRLVRGVDDVLGDVDLGDRIFAQIGDSTYKPRHFETVAALDAMTFELRFREASAIISHAGIGTLKLACDAGKPLLAMPRRRKFGEAPYDCQRMLADRFEAGGHILVARSADELAVKLTQLTSFVPQPRVFNANAVAERIGSFIQSVDRC